MSSHEIKYRLWQEIFLRNAIYFRDVICRLMPQIYETALCIDIIINEIFQ